MSHIEGLFDIVKSNVTKNIHRNVYPAIAPTRPELSQAGKTILITGGGANLGLAIAQAFVHAVADTVIIVGRRLDILEEARSHLEEEANVAGTGTKIIAHACDVTDRAQVDALWTELIEHLDIVVDVFVTNAAKPAQPKTILETGTDDIRSQLEVNASAPLYLTEKLHSQLGKKQKVSVPMLH